MHIKPVAFSYLLSMSDDIPPLVYISSSASVIVSHLLYKVLMKLALLPVGINNTGSCKIARDHAHFLYWLLSLEAHVLLGPAQRRHCERVPSSIYSNGVGLCPLAFLANLKTPCLVEYAQALLPNGLAIRVHS